MSERFASFVEVCRRVPPQVALVLGSGLADVAGHLDCTAQATYSDVPNLDATSVQGHRGELLLGTWAGRRVLLFAGRLHYYEGHPWRRVEQPVAIAHELGAKILILTNAAGGIRADLEPGHIVLLRDHIEWTRPYPSPAESRPNPYSPRLIELFLEAAKNGPLPLTTGVYAQVTGPCYETCAEIRALRAMGADVVGMSTAREIGRGHASGMECAALSCVTNKAAGLGEGAIHHGEVMDVGASMCANLGLMLDAFLRML